MSNILPSIQYLPLASISEARPTLLITSASASGRSGLAGINVVAVEVIPPIEKRASPGSVPALDVDVVIGLGGGRVMDTAKLRGTELGAEVICIPTLLSTDAFLTSTAAVRRGGGINYVRTGAPKIVIIDDALLEAAPAELHALGCCDVLSILTASEDWRRDSAARPSELALEAGCNICCRLLDSEDAIATGSSGGRQVILDALLAEVDLSNAVGERVEEGSEHYFAYALERRAPVAMHGALVGLGILLSASLQGQDISRLKRFMERTGISRGWSSVSLQALIETLVEMPVFVEQAAYSDSIWNHALITQPVAADLCGMVLSGVVTSW